MAKQFAPGATVYEIFALPINCTVLTPRIYLEGVNVTSATTVTGPTKVNATASTHEFYHVNYKIPLDAESRAVYQMVIDWKDPSGTLQPPLIFEAQVTIDAEDGALIEII